MIILKSDQLSLVEIMYHPQTNSDAEYVELLNISDKEVMLFDTEQNEGWRFSDEGGLDFIFPTPASSGPVTLGPSERLLLVKNQQAFESEFTALPGTQILQWIIGSLSNGGEKIQLCQPGDINGLGGHYWICVDHVFFSDGSHPVGSDPWPTEPDGAGQSLHRINTNQYGNDVSNWQSTAPMLLIYK
ncbi:MAG: lamin tail domain-containing protein [Phycisphaerae bacterium]|nr:lamin tail domain-containing protein [Phycisphaerae bacterium]